MAKLIQLNETQYVLSTKIVTFFIEGNTTLMIWLEGGFQLRSNYPDKETCKKNFEALADLIREDINNNINYYGKKSFNRPPAG